MITFMFLWIPSCVEYVFPMLARIWIFISFISFMPPQILLQTESFITILAWKWISITIYTFNHHIILDILQFLKSFVTIMTRIWSFISIYTIMILHILLFFKSHVTLMSGKWIRISVNGHTILLILKFLKSFITIMAVT